MTDAAVPEQPATTAALRVPWSEGAKLLTWGFLLSGLGALLIAIAASQSNDNGDGSGSSAAALGAILMVMGTPLLLVGVIAVGVRVGLRDHDGDR